MGQALLFVSGSSFFEAQGVQLPTVPGLTPEQVQAALSVQPPPMDIGPPLSVSQLLAQVATTAGPVLTYLQQSQLQQAVQPQLPLLVMTTGSVTPIVSVLIQAPKLKFRGSSPPICSQLVQPALLRQYAFRRPPPQCSRREHLVKAVDRQDPQDPNRSQLLC